MDHESPTLSGNQEYWKSEYFRGPGILEILDIQICWGPGILEILDIEELVILGAWKYWISTNMVSWVPGNIGYQPTWCTGFLGKASGGRRGDGGGGSMCVCVCVCLHEYN